MVVFYRPCLGMRYSREEFCTICSISEEGCKVRIDSHWHMYGLQRAFTEGLQHCMCVENINDMFCEPHNLPYPCSKKRPKGKTTLDNAGAKNNRGAVTESCKLSH